MDGLQQVLPKEGWEDSFEQPVVGPVPLIRHECPEDGNLFYAGDFAECLDDTWVCWYFGMAV